MKICIGIVSYFPDNLVLRAGRIRRLKELLLKLDQLFKSFPIIIIAQDWKNEIVAKDNYLIYNYNKLGILAARRTLRAKFLASDFDYMIMLDDDAMIQCSDASEYIHEITTHPDQVGIFRHQRCPLMLLAISKFIYSQIDMPQIVAENGEGFEDDLFVATLIKKFPDNHYEFSHKAIEETSFKYTGPGAVGSTWAANRKYNWQEMVAATTKRIQEVNNE